MRFQAFFQTVIMALLLSACGEQGTFYEKSPQAVRSALRSATLPYHVLGSSATGSRVTQPDENTVVTAVLGPNQSEMMRFVAIITPEGSGSRVAIEVRPPEGKNKDRATKAMGSNVMAMGMMEKLAAEHVDAAIQGRPFDMMFATGPMAKGMINANPEMKAQIDAANSSAQAMNQFERQSDREDSGFAEDAAEF